MSSPVVKIDVIQAELAQALIDRPLDVLGRRIVLGVVVLERELGRQEYFGTGIRSTLEVTSEHLFVIPVHVGSYCRDERYVSVRRVRETARFRIIGASRLTVPEGLADLDGPIENLEPILVRACSSVEDAHSHQAETETRDQGTLRS